MSDQFQRLREYLERRQQSRGLDFEAIHCFDGEYELRSSDISALLAEVEGLRKDAERYRWLREHADVTLDEPVQIVTDQGHRIHVTAFCRHETDRAIDAALAAQSATARGGER